MSKELYILGQITNKYPVFLTHVLTMYIFGGFYLNLTETGSTYLA